LGLPALEAFRCGVPVVSTRTFGVSDYGVDDHNLLLANANDPADLARQLRRILTDAPLAERLRTAAFATVEHDYDWEISHRAITAALDDIDRTYTGAGRVDPDAMRALSARLEAEGHFTPIETFRAFYRLSADAAAAYQSMSAARGAPPDAVASLQRVRDELRDYVGNPSAEYFSAFKAEYDRCQLVLNLTDDPRFSQYLDALLAHGQRRATAPAVARTGA